MSSLVGHVATAAAIHFGSNCENGPRPRWVLALLIVLAIAPDFDYFAFWLFGINVQPRVTHSLAFCLFGALMAWAATIRTRHRQASSVTFLALALASCSHLVLDLLVGVHPLPVFWPFASAEISSPIGILPSAAHVRLTNYYLWRNLVIECGVLLPVLATLTALSRVTPVRSILRQAVFVLPIWIGCLIWSLGLQR
jgi:inner membrane protein